MSGYEYYEWRLIEHIEPWGQKRADYQFAALAWIIASCHHSGKGRKPKFKDYLKMFDFEPKREQSDEEISMLFKRIAGKKK